MRSLPVILGCLTVAAMCPAQTPNWTQTRPSMSPTARGGHAMVYDSARQRVVLFSGGKIGFNATKFRDTWEWDGRNWSQRRPKNQPVERVIHAMAYDSVRRRTVLFGGLTGSTTTLRDTWEWDGSNWTDMKPTTAPLSRTGHVMAYDSFRQRTVVFGGKSGRSFLGDTWLWNGKVWTLANPSKSPSPRTGTAMAFDTARGRVVLFGGNINGAWVNDTWEWDGSNWSQIRTTSAPPVRSAYSMSYDSARQRTVIFGGLRTGGRLADTWEWDGTIWTQIKPASSPPLRSTMVMAYDMARQRTVLFGGFGGPLSKSTNLRDTWEYGIPNLTLIANTPTISIANGGSQILTLNAGTDLRNKSYWIFGSMTGTMPGVVLTGIHIPLRPDVYTDIAMTAVNGKEFKDFKRTLSATGTATASLNVPARLPIPTGFKLYHSYVVYDPTTGQNFTASNPVSVEFK